MSPYRLQLVVLSCSFRCFIWTDLPLCNLSSADSPTCAAARIYFSFARNSAIRSRSFCLNCASSPLVNRRVRQINAVRRSKSSRRGEHRGLIATKHRTVCLLFIRRLLLRRGGGGASLWEEHRRWIVVTRLHYLIFYYSRSAPRSRRFTVEIYKVNTAAFMMDIIPGGALVFLSLVSKTIKREREGAWSIDASAAGGRSGRWTSTSGGAAWSCLICICRHSLSLSFRTFISPGIKQPSVGKPVDVFPFYCPFYVPCNSPAPWAQLDRQTPKGAVSLGKARPISFPSGVRTPLNCHVGLLHRPWFGMTVLLLQQRRLLHSDLFWNWLGVRKERKNKRKKRQSVVQKCLNRKAVRRPHNTHDVFLVANGESGPWSSRLVSD